MAMLDHLDACGDRPLNGCRGIRMHRDIGAPILGGLNRGPQLVFGERGNIQWAVRRRHATAGRQLDLRSAEQELLTHADPHLIRRIGNHAAVDYLHARQSPA
jgi:hypothetical protein